MNEHYNFLIDTTILAVIFGIVLGIMVGVTILDWKDYNESGILYNNITNRKVVVRVYG